MQESVISEEELCHFRFNYKSAWKRCLKMIQSGELVVVPDTRRFDAI
jgi:hypothetical protein